mmetsp:Transcript_1333/g.4504  ORF Transcript_1333/g.4504 Transcript_1333/m.4504 type:complete len:229 (+) Transcript_1333:221-907(+)
MRSRRVRKLCLSWKERNDAWIAVAASSCSLRLSCLRLNASWIARAASSTSPRARPLPWRLSSASRCLRLLCPRNACWIFCAAVSTASAMPAASSAPESSGGLCWRPRPPAGACRLCRCRKCRTSASALALAEAPCLGAMCMALSDLVRDVSARYAAIPPCWFAAARSAGVTCDPPLEARGDGAAPAATRATTHSSCPRAAAQCSGVSPAPSCWSTSMPASAITRTAHA